MEQQLMVVMFQDNGVKYFKMKPKPWRAKKKGKMAKQRDKEYNSTMTGAMSKRSR